ncbi:MAG: hypothetical protein JSV51_07030 [Candidatus Bathyarchaeota archaeon]|nr:MAG: hypothetical protein JSV51_07030 [Candidatus Bathyarchaeota archaeon]
MANHKGNVSLRYLSLHRPRQEVRSVFKYRDRLTILIDILKSTQTSKNGKKKTQILQSANLSYHQLNKYLYLLLTNGFIAVNKNGMYRITAEGSRFANALEPFNMKLT